jgi:methylmalonyl-CoA mutase cobalamin-binding subunit
MIGTHRISQTMKSAVGATARRTVLHIGTRAGNRLIAVKFIQQLLKWLGIEVTKSTLVISLEYIISALCMSISAIVTFWLIYPMCNRLVEYLKEKNQRK